MFISEKLIFLQLPKSGCNSTAGIIKQIAGGEQMQIHKPLQNYDYTKKVAGNIRNPWDWYVSLWSYGCMGKGGLKDRLTHYNSKMSAKSFNSLIYPLFERMFKNTGKWAHLYSDVYNPELFRKWLKEMYSHDNKRWLGLGYHNHPVSGYAGFLTYRYGLLYLRNFNKMQHFDNFINKQSLDKFHDQLFLLDYVIYTENLVEDTLNVLNSLGYDAKQEYVQEEKIVKNKSKHLSSADYYNDETIEMVGKKEKLIVERYGYTKPSM